MKVKELIEKLKQMEQDLYVVRYERCLNCKDTYEENIEDVYECASLNDKSRVLVID